MTRYVWMVEIGLDMLGENVEAFKCSRTFTGPAWGECPGLAGGAESRGSGARRLMLAVVPSTSLVPETSRL